MIMRLKSIYYCVRNNLLMLHLDRFLVLLKCVWLPLATVYGASMLIYPWFAGGFAWSHVQDVWERWQSLNVGMLAFLSSIVALNISRIKEEKQREREFIASKAFLPAALSELTTYFHDCSNILLRGWRTTSGERPSSMALPTPPKDYRDVFRDCIRHASPPIGAYLSQMLVLMQIQEARLLSYVYQDASDAYFSPQKHNLIYHFRLLGEIQAITNKLFPFARSMADFDVSSLSWDDFHTAYANLEIPEEEIILQGQLNLESITKEFVKNPERRDARRQAPALGGGHEIRSTRRSHNVS